MPRRSGTYDRIVRVRQRPRWLDRLRALVLRIAARGFNYRDHASGWRVTFDGLEQAHTGLVCSVLFEPFAEIDLDELPQSDPEDGYFADLIEHLDRVEGELEQIDPPQARHLVVRSAADLEDAQSFRPHGVRPLRGGRLPPGPRRPRSPPTSRSWRDAARLRDARASLLPSHRDQRAGASDALRCDVQPHLLRAGGVGLTALARPPCARCSSTVSSLTSAHARRCAARHVRPARPPRRRKQRRSEGLPGDRIACRLPVRKAAVHLDPATIRQIARRDGVVGLILARHQLQATPARRGEGIGQPSLRFSRTSTRFSKVTAHIMPRRIGSDLDGLIKPTMSEVESAEDLAKLEMRCEKRIRPSRRVSVRQRAPGRDPGVAERGRPSADR